MSVVGPVGPAQTWLRALWKALQRIRPDHKVAGPQEAWLRATALIARQILRTDTSAGLQLILVRSLELAYADLAAIAVPTGSGDSLRIEVATGPAGRHLSHTQMSPQTSLAGGVFRSWEPAWIAEKQVAGGSLLLAPFRDVGSVLAVPLPASDGVRAVLLTARLHGRSPFAAADLDLLGDFADQAALALELVEL